MTTAAAKIGDRIIWTGKDEHGLKGTITDKAGNTVKISWDDGYSGYYDTSCELIQIDNS